MQVNFCAFAKKPNSTKIPPENITWHTYECTLKDTCSYIHPILEVRLTQTHATNPTLLNYCHIPDFRRYYHITDWIFNNNLWSAILTVDPLASWRTQIGLSTQYVVRSSAEYNNMLTDGQYPVDSFVTSDYQLKSPFVNSIDDGVFIVGITGSEPVVDTNYATQYYVFDAHSFNLFIHYLYSDAFAEILQITEIETQLVKGLINPIQYITSCNWFPLPKNKIPRTHQSETVFRLDTIQFGYWDIPVNTNSTLVDTLTPNPCYETSVYDEYEVLLPKHPQSATRGRYLEMSPYTYMKIKYPYFSDIELNSVYTVNTSINDNERTLLRYWLTVDLITGACKMKLTTSTSEIGRGTMCVADSVCCIPFEVTQLSTDYVAKAQSMANVVNNIGESISQVKQYAEFTGKANVPTATEPSSYAGHGNTSFQGLLGTIAGTVSSLISNVKYMTPALETIGGRGTFIETYTRPLLQVIWAFITEDDNNRYGKPLCEQRRIIDIGGFIMCDRPILECGASLYELSMIYEVMGIGFYFE